MVETILFVFSLVALGYFSGAIGYLRSETGEGLADFAVNVAMPLLLFRTMVTADFSGSSPWMFWLTYFVAVIVTWAAGHLLMVRVFGYDNPAGVVGGVCSAFSNLVLLGVPFTLGVYGQAGVDVLSILIAIHLPTMILASIVLFEVFAKASRHDGPLAIAAMFSRRIVGNPLIIAIAAGLLWSWTGLGLPGLPGHVVNALADMAGTIALFAMGLSLSRFGISGSLKPSLALAALKLVLMPAVAFGLAWSLGLPPLTAKVAVTAAALPAGVNSYLIAVQLGTGQAIATNQMTLATGFAVFTTTAWVALANWAF